MSFKQGFLRILAAVGCFFTAVTPIQLYPCERPISWEKISQIYAKDIPPGSTFRSMEGEQIYGVWKAQMRSKNTSIPQFIKDKILGFGNDPQKPIYHIKNSIIQDQSVQIYTTGQLDYLGEFQKNAQKFKRRIGVQKGSRFVLLTINNFPYDIQPGIHHWVIWSHKPYILTIIEQVLRDVMKEGVQWQLYQNPAHLKSIPQISHYQMFIRQKPSEEIEEMINEENDL